MFQDKSQEFDKKIEGKKPSHDQILQELLKNNNHASLYANALSMLSNMEKDFGQLIPKTTLTDNYFDGFLSTDGNTEFEQKAEKINKEMSNSFKKSQKSFWLVEASKFTWGCLRRDLGLGPDEEFQQKAEELATMITDAWETSQKEVSKDLANGKLDNEKHINTKKEEFEVARATLSNHDFLKRIANHEEHQTGLRKEDIALMKTLTSEPVSMAERKTRQLPYDHEVLIAKAKERQKQYELEQAKIEARAKERERQGLKTVAIGVDAVQKQYLSASGTLTEDVKPLRLVDILKGEPKQLTIKLSKENINGLPAGKYTASLKGGDYYFADNGERVKIWPGDRITQTVDYDVVDPQIKADYAAKEEAKKRPVQEAALEKDVETAKKQLEDAGKKLEEFMRKNNKKV